MNSKPCWMRSATALLLAACGAACSGGNSASTVTLTVDVPAPIVAGTPSAAKVSIVDGNGHPRSDFRGTVHFTAEDAHASLPADYAFTAADAGSHSFQVTLVTVGTPLITAAAVEGSLIGRARVTVVAGPTATFAIRSPPTISWCGTSNVEVAATDSVGNLTDGYRGTVRLESDDPDAVLPVDYTFTFADGGRHNFLVGLRTPGNRKISVTDASKSISASVDTRTGGWCPIGPDHAFIMALAGDPRDPSVVYAGTFEGGIFKTSDGGANWAPMNAGLRTMFIPSIVVDPQSPGTVYATGGIGIYKSTDGGANWTDTFDAAGVKLALDPSSPGTIYAATDAGVNGFGVLRSTNAGLTWAQLNTGLPPTNVGMTAFALDPAAPSVLYASFRDQTTYLTTDAGAHWTPITGPFAGHDVLSLAVDAHSVVFLGTNFGSWVSNDHGANWTATGLGTGVGGARMLIDPRSPSIVYAGGGLDTFKSVDGGATWTFFTVSATAIAADPAGSSVLAGTSEDGVLKSTDGLITWLPVNRGLRASIAQAVVLGPGGSADVFAATAGHFSVSHDGGATWNESPLIDVQALALDPRSTGTIYASGSSGPQKSVDGGAHWTRINPVAGPDAMTTMAMAPDNPSTLYFGTQRSGMAKTADGGNTGTAIGPAGTWIWSIAVDGNKPGTVYATTMNGPVLKSSDGGKTLAALSGLPTNFDFIPIVVLPDSTVVVAFREGIFRSRDQGATWTAATGLPSFLFPGAMAADPAVPGAVYLVDLESVHRSVDGGATWTTTSSGFPREQGIFSLAVFDDTLYAAARGLGIFKNFAAGD